MANEKTIRETRKLPLHIRQDLQDVVRNHLQVIAAHAEEVTDVVLPLPVRERLDAIREAVNAMDLDLRRRGL